MQLQKLRVSTQYGVVEIVRLNLHIVEYVMLLVECLLIYFLANVTDPNRLNQLVIYDHGEDALRMTSC